MTIDLHKLAVTSVLALGLGASPALADCHGDWDTNQDAMVDQTEFGTAYADNGWFGEADMDDDGYLSEDEFNTGLYGSYDADDDSLFSEEEQQVGFSMTEDYGAWDSDADNALSEDEFGAGMTEVGTFADWDADSDGLISEDEFGAGVYGGYDADESGMIEETETSAWCDDYGEEGFWDW